jgi:hypothetical protein
MRRDPAATETFTKLGIEFKAHFDLVTDDDGDSWLALSGEYINGKSDYLPPRVEARLYELAEGTMQHSYEMRDFR